MSHFLEGKYLGFNGRQFEIGVFSSSNILNLAGWDSGIYSITILESGKVIYENNSVMNEYAKGNKIKEDEDRSRIIGQGVWHLENIK